MAASIARQLLNNNNNLRLARQALRLTNYHQRRYLDLHEYQSKQILQDNGIQVQRFKVVSNRKELNDALYSEDELSRSEEFVVKAQVLAGGRGKGYFRNSGLKGGVRLTQDPLEACRLTECMLNDFLVTKQTTQQGVFVEKVMIAEAVRLEREYYLAMVLDRSYGCGPILVTSPMGGMDIEEVAARDDTAIRKFTMPIDLELDEELVKRMVVAGFDLNLNDLDLIEQLADQIMKLHQLFLKLDAIQIEINPLGVTNRRQVISVDAKINFDENARFRHKWLDNLEQVNESENEASKYNLNYIALDGNIGCLVNGAGLAMATMDIIKLHGGNPANFLDVGGGATVEQVTEAFRIISSDPKVQVILVNIFGGIMRCDIIAEGIKKAVETLNLKIPIVCRLQGTRASDAQALLEASNVSIHACDDLDEATKMAVQMTKTSPPL